MKDIEFNPLLDWLRQHLQQPNLQLYYNDEESKLEIIHEPINIGVLKPHMTCKLYIDHGQNSDNGSFWGSVYMKLTDKFMKHHEFKLCSYCYSYASNWKIY